MNIKEQEIIEKTISEASTADYTKVSTKELKDLLNIFSNVSRSAAKPIIRTIKAELNSRLKEDCEIEEAKVVPFKKLEQAWTRTNGDKAKQAKLIKKHDLKKLISSVRPGEIKLGIKNKLLGTTKAATAVGLDLDDELIFITNNPLKIIYPKKSTRRPEGEEIKESKVVKDVKTLRLEKIVSLTIKEDCEDIVESFISKSNIKADFTPAQILNAYKTYSLSEAAADLRKLKTSNRVNEETELEEASASDIKKVLAAAKKAGGKIKGNQIDFGMGAVIDVSIEKGKIKLDAGLSNGVEYFKNAKDAIMAFESVELEEAFSRLPGNIINNELYTVEKDLKAFVSSQRNGNDVNEKQLNSIIKNLQSIKKEIKKFNKPEDVPVRYQYKESADLEEAKIPSSNISKFSSPQAAKQAASKQKYKTQIFMGDDDKFWVPSTNKEAGQLKKAGYEVYESVDLEEAIKSWEVIVIKPVNKLKKNQKVTVKAANTVTAIKKAAKLFKIDDKLITGKVDVKLLESTNFEEASDKDLDIKSIKALIKNPSPKMIKQYGGKDKYIKMLKSKLTKLESTNL
jgi:3D (Asp-Asp-Asp) domain-containing protein